MFPENMCVDQGVGGGNSAEPFMEHARRCKCEQMVEIGVNEAT